MAVSAAEKALRERTRRKVEVLAARFMRKHGLAPRHARECARIANGYGGCDFIGQRREGCVVYRSAHWTRKDVVTRLRWFAANAYWWYGPMFGQWPGEVAA